MPVTTHKYTNGVVTIIWKPEICQHSKKCWKNLREVFDPFVKPWINMQGASTERIIEQVKECPSGALSFVINDEITSEHADV